MFPVSQLYQKILWTCLGMKPRKILLMMLCLNLAVRLEGGRIQVQQPKVQKPEKFSFFPVAWKIRDKF